MHIIPYPVASTDPLLLVHTTMGKNRIVLRALFTPPVAMDMESNRERERDAGRRRGATEGEGTSVASEQPALSLTRKKRFWTEDSRA